MNWRIIAALAVILIAAFAWLLIANANLRARLALMQAENTALHISNENFKADVEKQNRAVSALQADADSRAQRALKFNKAADVAANGFMADAAHIAGLHSGSDQCRASDALLSTYIRALK